MKTIVYKKNITILGVSIPLEKTFEYNTNEWIPDAVMIDRAYVEQEIMSYLCWKQFLDTQSTCCRIQDYFYRISKEYAKDYILHRKTT